jgi:AmmeMemoRadiSam system protein A
VASALEETSLSLCAVARQAIERWLAGAAEPPPADQAAPRHAVFVTLRTADLALRGCMGSLTPVAPDVVAETARSAVLAASSDPRFPPVGLEELADIRIEVSVLLPEQRNVSLEDLDPALYGVVVRDGAGRRGLLLPGIPGIEDAATQLRVARSKAGIPPDRAVTLGRFEVRKFAEPVGAAGIEPATSSV